MKKAVFGLTALLSLGCTSCSNSSRIYPVSGKVTYEGYPATGAAVFFYRHGGDPLNDPMIMGIVQQDGAFELVCGSLGKGAPAGVYDVMIEWKDRSKRDGGRGNARDKLKGHYADPKHPVLQAKVESENNDLPPFELKEAKPGSDG